MKIISVVGARPNFVKIAPLARALTKHPEIQHLLVHTGQHYDPQMSQSFFDELGIQKPNINLEIGSGTAAEQVGHTLIAFEKVCLEERPDWVIVVGDVNATIACSLAAKKLGIKVAHIEAGLRSRDYTMPEEINRVLTDRISDLFFTTDALANENLLAEGADPESLKLVGNIMIDTLEDKRAEASALNPVDVVSSALLDSTKHNVSELVDEQYAVVTLHRPATVDDSAKLTEMVRFITETVAQDLQVIWPVHPRTRKQLESFGLWSKLSECPAVFLTEPLSYVSLLRLNMGAKMMLTDSGGLQEECCILGTPCLTLRDNTERPITLREHGGLNVLVGTDIEVVQAEYTKALNFTRAPFRPPFWDGMTAERIAAELAAL